MFDFRRRNAATDAGAVARRNELAAAIENAGKPQRAPVPQPQRAGKAGMGMRMFMQSGEMSRLTGDWPTQPVNADWIVTRYQRALVARSREQAVNNDIMRAFLRVMRLNIVGPEGIRFYSQAMRGDRPDMRARAAINAAWAWWGRKENCDVAGTLSWLGMQRTVIDTVARDGEVFVQFVFGADAGPAGVALRMIDPQRCPVEYDRKDLPDGRFIRQGIEFNRYGKPLRYHFVDDDAENGEHGYSLGGRKYSTVEAGDIIHLFVQEFPGQKRGMPWASTGLYRAKHTQAMEDAAVVNARVGAAKMGFVEFDEGFGPDLAEGDDLYIDAEAGAFPVLPQGARIKEFAPQYPQGEFAPFTKHMNRSFATGGGVSYHSLSGDLEGVNFSSIRHGTLEEREGFKERQEWMREGFQERVFEAVFPRLLLAGLVKDDKGSALPAARRTDFMACRWQPRRWTWIDPQSDVNAAEKWKNNLLESPSQLIREEGRDPDQVFAEIGQDIKAMQEAGIPLEVIAASMGRPPAPAAPAPKEKATEGKTE
ncbi:phage portal protein [Stenotrophomonas maltophilia]|uniref:phage portal protein n=1 Tax=Stenotrophomonas maltophilia TaxID=40324 RepID=UPI002B1DBBAA|nr:phage portal protein [Stenotrophomonas maltophilia]